MNDQNRHVYRIDFATLIRQLDPSRLVQEWLPEGKRQGNEWVTRNPTRQDKQAGSFSVNLTNGKWSDFATGDAGGDLLSLWAYMHHGRDQKAAAYDLAQRYRIDARSDSPANRRRFNNATESTPGQTSPPPAAPKDEWLLVTPIPREMKKPTELKHRRLGKPSRYWTYRDANGLLMFYICRFDPEGERKQILPYAYWTNKKMEGRWQWKGISGKQKRPLYGLDRLAQNPDQAVVVCEGEKAAEYCQRLVPNVVAVSWMNGAGNEAKADWSPLQGRKVIIWPDNDDSGRKAANGVAGQLKGIAKEIAMVLVPRTLPEKWDAADATAEQARQLVEKARPLEELPRGFTLNRSGLIYCDPNDDQPDGANLSRLLVEQSKASHGQPARAFLAKLAEHRDEAICLIDSTREHFTTFVAPATADGQVKRVADRFAIVAAGGELASGWGITGWPQGAATDAAESCFQSWLENRGTSGSLEDKQAIEQVRSFFQMHGRSRFGDDQATEESIRDRAGFIKQDQGERLFLVFPQVFREEICTGLDHTQVARLLVEKGFLVKDGRHYQRKVSLQNGSRPRLYMIRGSILDED